MLNRKLGFIFAALSLMALPVASYATTARLEGMSLPADYTSDFTNIYSWPSAVTRNRLLSETLSLGVAA